MAAALSLSFAVSESQGIAASSSSGFATQVETFLNMLQKIPLQKREEQQSKIRETLMNECPEMPNNAVRLRCFQEAAPAVCGNNAMPDCSSRVDFEIVRIMTQKEYFTVRDELQIIEDSNYAEKKAAVIEAKQAKLLVGSDMFLRCKKKEVDCFSRQIVRRCLALIQSPTAEHTFHGCVVGITSEVADVLAEIK
jgi:hypothetical protein